MKTHALTIILILFSIHSYSQVPKSFSYQGVARDVSGNPITSTNVSVRASVHDGSPTGTIQYQETQTSMTNGFGLFKMEIGNGTSTINAFDSIVWEVGTKFLEIEFDPLGGTNYILSGTTQILSVPYALYSSSTGDTSEWLKNMNNIYFSKGNVGIKTSNPKFSLNVNGSILLEDRGQRILFGSGIPIEDSICSIYRPVGTDGIMMDGNDIYIKSKATPIQLQSVSTINMKDLSGNTKMTFNTQNSRMGVGNTNPTSTVTVTGGDVNITDINSGVILKSPNGQCWRVTVDNTGNLIRTSITCP